MISQIQNSPSDIADDGIHDLNKIKLNGSKRQQLQKVSEEFESLFVTKIMTLMDKTVDKENGLFGEDEKYMSTFKSYIFQEMGRNIAKNPRTSFGFAKQMYQQMEKYLPPEKTDTVNGTEGTDKLKPLKTQMNTVDKEI